MMVKVTEPEPPLSALSVAVDEKVLAPTAKEYAGALIFGQVVEATPESASVAVAGDRDRLVDGVGTGITRIGDHWSRQVDTDRTAVDGGAVAGESVAVPESVWLAPSPLIVWSLGQVAMPESASLQVQ